MAGGLAGSGVCGARVRVAGRRSQVASRRSQVASRKSQVAGTVWREVVKDPTSFIRPALGTHPPKSRLLIIYLPGG